MLEMIRRAAALIGDAVCSSQHNHWIWARDTKGVLELQCFQCHRRKKLAAYIQPTQAIPTLTRTNGAIAEYHIQPRTH